MPQPVQRKNIRQPLKLLRAILSDDPNVPISQRVLGDYIHTPLNTIKTIEAGRAPMGGILAGRIRAELGAQWVEWQRRWEFAFPLAGEHIPYTHELFVAYRHLMDTPPPDRDTVGDHIAWKVALLLRNITPQHFNALRFRLERAIAGWQSEFEIAGQVPIGEALQVDLAEYMNASRPTFLLSFDSNTGKLSTLEVISTATEMHKPDFPAIVVEPCKSEAEAPANGKRRRATKKGKPGSLV